jgi:hypothetical protein
MCKEYKFYKIEIERLLTVWTEDCIQERILLSRAVIHKKKALNLCKRMKRKYNEVGAFNTNVYWSD